MTNTDPDVQRLEALSKLMDNQFRIPGTSIRFGLDSIIGLIPYAGDFVGLLVSLTLFGVTVKKGAGPILLLRMGGNIALDTIVGAIPFVGDLFDLGFKSNQRNVKLLHAYYSSGKSHPGPKTTVLYLAIVILLLIGLVIYATVKLIAYIWESIAHAAF